jgi:hypothetical protein
MAAGEVETQYARMARKQREFAASSDPIAQSARQAQQQQRDINRRQQLENYFARRYQTAARRPRRMTRVRPRLRLPFIGSWTTLGLTVGRIYRVLTRRTKVRLLLLNEQLVEITLSETRAGTAHPALVEQGLWRLDFMLAGYKAR